MKIVPCSTLRRPLLQGYSKRKNAIYLFQPRCKQWSCPSCAVINQWEWSKKIVCGVATYINAGLIDWHFITITSDEKNETFSQTIYVWPRGWKKLSSRMRYHFKGVRYVLLPEQHKDGRLHVHALVSHAITERWIKDNAPYVGLGNQAASKPLANVWYAARYVTKYLSKGLGVLDWPPKFRRIRTSQRWPEVPKEPWEDTEQIDWHYRASVHVDDVEAIAESVRVANQLDVIVL